MEELHADPVTYYQAMSALDKASQHLSHVELFPKVASSGLAALKSAREASVVHPRLKDHKFWRRSTFYSFLFIFEVFLKSFEVFLKSYSLFHLFHFKDQGLSYAISQAMREQ